MSVNDLKYACTYTLDDPLILSSSTLKKDHLDKLDKDLQRLQDKAPESTFATDKVEYLWYTTLDLLPTQKKRKSCMNNKKPRILFAPLADYLCKCGSTKMTKIKGKKMPLNFGIISMLPLLVDDDGDKDEWLIKLWAYYLS